MTGRPVLAVSLAFMRRRCSRGVAAAGAGGLGLGGGGDARGLGGALRSRAARSGEPDRPGGLRRRRHFSHPGRSGPAVRRQRSPRRRRCRRRRAYRAPGRASGWRDGSSPRAGAPAPQRGNRPSGSAAPDPRSRRRRRVFRRRSRHGAREGAGDPRRPQSRLVPGTDRDARQALRGAPHRRPPRPGSGAKGTIPAAAPAPSCCAGAPPRMPSGRRNPGRPGRFSTR